MKVFESYLNVESVAFVVFLDVLYCAIVVSTILNFPEIIPLILPLV